VLRQPKKFQSRAITVLDQPSAVFNLTGGEGAIAKLNALRAKYGLLAKTRRITAGVAKRTGIPEGHIAGAIDVTLPGPTQVILISATTGNPERSRNIANATADELGAFVKSEQDAVKIPAKDQIKLTIAAPAQPGRQIEPTRSRAMTVGVLAGLLGLVACYLIADAIRARRLRR
jgi:capsular polysaccharide biosynthesis protein